VRPMHTCRREKSRAKPVSGRTGREEQPRGNFFFHSVHVEGGDRSSFCYIVADQKKGQEPHHEKKKEEGKEAPSPVERRSGRFCLCYWKKGEKVLHPSSKRKSDGLHRILEIREDEVVRAE